MKLLPSTLKLFIDLIRKLLRKGVRFYLRLTVRIRLW